MYRVVEVPANPAACEAVLNTQLAEGYTFAGWLRQPSAVLTGYGIFYSPPEP